jgi:parallel beta-helix repeat protein
MPPINNAGMVALIEPSSAICPGVHPVHVSLINAGLNTLNNVQLHWQVNGVTQSPVAYTGPLAAAIVIGGQNIDTVNLGNVTLTAASPLVVKVWTTMPNGVADTDNSNDTLTFTLVSAMNGAYTINAANPTSGTNYQTFTDFTNDLLLKGICGPVVANVNAVSGPYEETVKFGNINGSSAINTITVNGNGATVEFDNTTTNRQMLTLSGTQYVKLDSLTFKTLNSTYGWGALITNNSAHDSITRCVFDLTSVTGTASASGSGICFSASATAATTAGTNGTNCYIGGNHVKATSGGGGTYYALTIAGTSDSNVVEHNIFENYYMYGIYISNATGTRVLSNELHRTTKTDVTTFYGIYTTGATPGTKIIGNRIHTPGGTEVGSTSTAYCIYPGGDGLATNRNLVANNIVYDINQGGVIYGIYGLTAEQADIVHNTIDLSVAIPNTSTSTVYGIYLSGSDNNTNVKNNNVSITGGTGGTKYGFYYSTATSVADAQRNNFYVNSTQGGTQNYGYLTTAYATPAAFQAAYPALETGSISEDPEFASATTGNLIPLNTNLYNNGVNLLTQVPVDINGLSRSATPTPGAFELQPSMFDNTGAYALINPSGTFCSGPRMVEVAIINEGINEVTDVEIHWIVNGVPQATLNYTNTIDHVYSGDNMDTVSLGLANFPAGVPSVVKVWTSLPNGVADPDNENDTITITVQPSYSVVVNLGNDTNVCHGVNVTLDAGNTGATYLWSNGNTAQTNVINTPGQHYVTVTDNDACIGSDTLNLTTTPLPVVNLGNDTFICPGSVIILDAGNAGGTYLWDDGSTGQTRSADEEATYSVTVSANGCSASDAINISLIDQPAADGINATYSDSATYIFYPINPQFASTYVWNFGDGSPEVTSNFVQHTYTQNGIYTVTLSLEGICDGAILTIERTVDVFDAAGTTGINDQETNNQWNLYPNPGRTYLVVENKAGLIIKNAAVYNVAGQKVFSETGNGPKMTINTENFTSGLYLLKVETKNGWVIRKFEILK